MTLDPVNNENGILLLKQGQLLKQDNYFNLACVYNISNLHITSIQLMSLYASAKASENVVSGELHKTYRDQIEYSLRQIGIKIKFLTPQIRRRRGLINGLGTVVKSITGNLDSDDAAKFEEEISNIRNKINSVQDSQRKSLVLAKNTIDEFGNQFNKLNSNQKNLASLLRNITQNSSDVTNHLHFLDIYVQIDFSLQIILDRLMLLEDAMTFAQLGTMHPSILSPQNLLEELINLNKIHSFRPVADISLNNIHRIEKSIKVKAYSTVHSINFILEIPSVTPKTYDLIHVYSIPNKNNLTIIPKSKYLALGNDEYAYLEEDCQPLSDDIQLCKVLDTRRIEDTEDCLPSLIQHRQANCTHAKMNLKRGKIQKISDNKWLLIIKEDEIIKTQCKTKTDYKKLTGIYLVTLTEDCEMNIMNKTLRSHTDTIVVNEIIPLPEQHQVLQETIQYELQLEDISLDSIHELINKASDLSIPDTINWPMIIATPSWTTLLLYILLIAATCWKLYQWKTTKIPEDTKGSEDAARSKSCFYLMEGGVNSS